MEEEIEILKSIYIDDIINIDLTSDKPSFEIEIYPLENEEDKKKSLRLNLITYFPSQYPNEVPEFKFKNVRGITESDVDKISNEVKLIASKNIGDQMLFEIIQFIKDWLSSFGNVPTSCNCSICLSDFVDKDNVINLKCYHYFHTKCLSKHVEYMEIAIEKERAEAIKNKIKWNNRMPACPVCREPMNDQEIQEIRDYSGKIKRTVERDEIEEHFKYVISPRMREIQLGMKHLFEKQKLNGGIIDNTEQEVIVLTRPARNETNSTPDDLTETNQ